MKSRRNVVAVLAVLVLLHASPSRADWTNPTGDVGPSDLAFNDMITGARWSLQIAQAAF